MDMTSMQKLLMKYALYLEICPDNCKMHSKNAELNTTQCWVYRTHAVFFQPTVELNTTQC